MITQKFTHKVFDIALNLLPHYSDDQKDGLASICLRSNCQSVLLTICLSHILQYHYAENERGKETRVYIH